MILHPIGRQTHVAHVCWLRNIRYENDKQTEVSSILSVR
jgi:hypothetical protein